MQAWLLIGILLSVLETPALAQVSFVTMWGSEGGGSGQFRSPSGLAFDSSGILYVADQYNQRIQKFTNRGQYVGEWRGFSIP